MKLKLKLVELCGRARGSRVNAYPWGQKYLGCLESTEPPSPCTLGKEEGRSIAGARASAMLFAVPDQSTSSAMFHIESPWHCKYRGFFKV